MVKREKTLLEIDKEMMQAKMRFSKADKFEYASKKGLVSTHAEQSFMKYVKETDFMDWNMEYQENVKNL